MVHAMSQFLHALRGGPLLMDGATGTQLQARGLPPAECGEAWNLTQPDVVQSIHAEYVAAGAECLLTNTFQANPVALARHGLQDHVDSICRAALQLARSAAAGRLVVADVGPIITSGGEEFRDLDVLRRAVLPLSDADALLLETCSSPRALAAAGQITSWPETSHLPVILSLTYRRHSDGRLTTLSGHDPQWFARRARDHGVSVLGVNCGRDVGLDEIVRVLKEYREETDLPLMARPNAGTPNLVDGRCVYPLTSRQFAERVPDLVAAGASLVGGCCGTMPEHVAACRQAILRDVSSGLGGKESAVDGMADRD
jgi:5-methyltetrahydrofolate--homocysteine methyltransferase